MVREIDSQDGKQKSCWLDQHQYNRGWNGALLRADESFFYSRNQNSFKFVHFFMDTIIAFQGDHVMPALVLKDKDWISYDNVFQMQKESEANSGAVSLENILNKDITFNIYSYVEWGGFICFWYQNRESYFVLHNIETKSSRITPLFINDLVYGVPMLVNNFGCADSKGIYEVLDTYSIMQFVERSQEDNFLNTHLDKIEELKRLPDDSNPVIFYYQY
jgi:hypothetical protein